MDERKIVRRGYDELAATDAPDRSAGRRELAVVTEFLDRLPNPTYVLDAGCGQGTPVLPRLQTRATAVGLDLSREQLRVAAEAVSAIPLVCGEMTTLPFRDDAFSAVVACNSVIHLPLDAHRTAIAEFARVLRPGGHVLLSEAPEERTRRVSDWLDGGVGMTWSMAGAEATVEQLRNAGFRPYREWEAPTVRDGEDPKPPFFAARLEE